MTRPSHPFLAALLVASALGASSLLATAASAASDVQQIKLGDRFTGTIATAGVDTVAARFNGVQGTLISVKVRAGRGSTVEPTIALLDKSGAALDLGPASSERRRRAWLRKLELPASGHYTLVIGASSGSGDFEARTFGQLPNKVEVGTLSGTVTNGLTGDGLPGVAVSTGSFRVVTDADGRYAAELPVGQYPVSFEEPRFESDTETVTILERVRTTVNVALMPVAPVIVSVTLDGDETPGGVLTAVAAVDILDGSALESFAWAQTSGPPAGLDGADTDTATVTLASREGFKDALMHVLAEPPIGEADLPPNVPPPEGEFPGGLQDRFQVVGLNPFALEESALVSLEVMVTTSSGAYAAAADVHTELPWRPGPGIRNVPIGSPVLVRGKEQAAYDWTLAAPAGSGAELLDPLSQTPEFTPDVVGMYAVTENATATTLEIYAGTWKGVIVGQDADGRPVADMDCTGCHSPDGTGPAPDKFTPWAQTGHAEIFTENLDTSTHYGESCFGCHTVGFDPGVVNGGVDDTDSYLPFLFSGLLNNPGDNWTAVLAMFPDTARLANIQCENCHGPQEGNGHSFNPANPVHASRVDLSADVCAQCHGEPLRHARFQQWQLSAHANYELAIDEGDSGNCSRCHTANGFLTWLPILLDDDPATDPTDSITVTWGPDETHPQTCATCHDPHAIGTTTGIDTNATVRISGNTPPLIAGFRAIGVGKGAMCMTCHNSRRGLRNDDTFDDFVGTSEAARAPHGSAQTDLVMGENAYLVPVGIRGRHSFVTDTCVNCHMERTPPPDLLSYNQGGTNHTFFASETICSRCHGDAFDAEGVQSGVDVALAFLQDLEEDALLELIADLTAVGNAVNLDDERLVDDAAEIAEIVFGEASGRQAITVTFVDGSVVGPTRVSDISVVDPAGVDIGQLYDFADARLIKAGWNWNLVNNDGSHGVHNPTFAFQVLDASIDALSELAME